MPLFVLCSLTFVIHLVGTLAYAVRIAGVRTGRIAVSFALFNVLILVSRTSNTFQGPFLAKRVEQGISAAGSGGSILSDMRWLLLAATAATLVGAVFIPTFQRWFSRAVQHFHVPLHGLPGAGRDYGPALLMDIEHELFGFALRIAEDLLEHVGHIGHEVHRVVPHDGDPRRVGDDFLMRFRALYLCWCHAHRRSPPHAPPSSVSGPWRAPVIPARPRAGPDANPCARACVSARTNVHRLRLPTMFPSAMNCAIRASSSGSVRSSCALRLVVVLTWSLRSRDLFSFAAGAAAAKTQAHGHAGGRAL